MRTILSRVKVNGRQICALLALMLLSAVTSMLLPTALARMIDGGVAAGSRSTILIVALVMAVLALLGCLFNIAATVLSAKVSTRFAADLRREVFHRVQDLSAAEVEKFGTASLVTRSTSDVTNVQMFLSLLLRLGVTAPLMAVAGLVTGRDLIDQLKDKEVGERLLIPANMLRSGERVFLDDVTVAQAEEALGVPIVPVEQDGGALLDAMLGLNSLQPRPGPLFGGGEEFYCYNPGAGR